MTCVSYIINLDRSPDRLQFMLAQMRAFGSPFERVAAVDGSHPSEGDRSVYGDALRASRLGRGETGCFLSHHKAWQRIYDSGAAWGAVLEDDVLLSEDYARILSDLSWIRADASLVKIEAQPYTKVRLSRGYGRVGNRRCRRLRGLCASAGAYLASRAFCRRQLDQPPAVALPLDLYLFDPRSAGFGATVTYALMPALAIQTLLVPRQSGTPFLQSVIEPDRHPDRHLPPKRETVAGKRNVPRAIKREMRRLVEQARALIAWAVVEKPIPFR